MVDFPTLKRDADSPSLVNKVLEAVAFLAPEDAPAIETLTGSDGELAPLSPEYVPVGLVTRDGFTFGGDTNTETVEALGYAQPVREDIVGYTRTVTFTAYETMRKPILALAYGMSLDDVEQATSGEVTFDRPPLPEQKFYRLIVIGRDGSRDRNLFRAKFFPRVSITSIPEEAWGSDALQFEITLSTYVDDEIGTGEREFIAGSGAAANADRLGFAPAGAFGGV